MDAKRDVAAQLASVYESITAFDSDPESEFYKYTNYIGKTLKAFSLQEDQSCDSLSAICEKTLTVAIDFDVPEDPAIGAKAGKEIRVLRGFISTMALIEDTLNKESKMFNVLNTKLKRAEQYIEEHETSKPDMEGMLTVRGGGKTYVVLQKDGVIHRYKEGKEPEDDPLDIVMVTVKPFTDTDPDNKHKFELHSPKLQKPLVLAAPSFAEKNEWVHAIQASIEARLNLMSADPSSYHAASGAGSSSSSLSLSVGASSSSQSSTAASMGSGNENAGENGGNLRDQLEPHEKELEPETITMIRSMAGNNVCAECGAADPDWASIKLGIVICLECSGIHRSLGTHISKVRSLTLDKWLPEYVLFLCKRGNAAANKFLEANVPKEVVRLNPRTQRQQREEYIKNKYVKHLYAAKMTIQPPLPEVPTEDDLSKALYGAVSKCPINMDAVVQLLLNGADPNYVCKSEAYKTPLICATITGNILAVEVLLQYGGNPDAKDIRGWTPIHYAAYFNRPRCLRRLITQLKRGSVKDNAGLSPLDVATWNEAKECIQLLTGNSGSDTEFALTVDKVVNTPSDVPLDDTFTFPKNLKVPPLYVCVTIPHVS